MKPLQCQSAWPVMRRDVPVCPALSLLRLGLARFIPPFSLIYLIFPLDLPRTSILFISLLMSCSHIPVGLFVVVLGMNFIPGFSPSVLLGMLC